MVQCFCSPCPSPKFLRPRHHRIGSLRRTIPPEYESSRGPHCRTPTPTLDPENLQAFNNLIETKTYPWDVTINPTRQRRRPNAVRPPFREPRELPMSTASVPVPEPAYSHLVRRTIEACAV